MSSLMSFEPGQLGTSCGNPGGAMTPPGGIFWLVMQVSVPQAFAPSLISRAYPDDSTSIRLPFCTFVFVPHLGLIPTCFPGVAYGVPSARTYLASRTPHFLSIAVAVWQRSMAFAPLIGLVSPSARLSSHVGK